MNLFVKILSVVLSGLLALNTWAGSYDDFFLAVKQDNPVAVQDLLNRGIDPNLLSPEQVPAIIFALRISSFKVSKVLFEHPGLDVNILSKENESPLMLAALRGQLGFCQILIERNADVNKTGWAPLHYAATAGHLSVMQLLLDNHAFIDAASPNGSTPLMMAAMYGTSDAVKLLLESGADWTIKNEKDLTAIDFAIKASKKESVDTISAFIRTQNKTGEW